MSKSSPNIWLNLFFFLWIIAIKHRLSTGQPVYNIIHKYSCKYSQTDVEIRWSWAAEERWIEWSCQLQLFSDVFKAYQREILFIRSQNKLGNNNSNAGLAWHGNRSHVLRGEEEPGDWYYGNRQMNNLISFGMLHFSSGSTRTKRSFYSTPDLCLSLIISLWDQPDLHAKWERLKPTL